MATIKEVAKRARVSVGTVSHVLTGTVPVSPRLHARVLAAARQLNYHPDHVARSLKIRRTKTLGMVISDITNPFFPQLVRGAEDACLHHHYMLITVNSDDQLEREKEILIVLRSRGVDGVLLVVAPNKGDISHFENMIAAGIPIVCLDRMPPGISVDSVTVDNVRAAQECVSHLLASGHHRVGIIAGSMGLQTARDRLRGYKQALRNAGIAIDPKLIREGDFRMESGYQLGRELLAVSDRPSALFISNGMMALGILRALEELGLHCPQDVALGTFDDLAVWDVVQPHMTVVKQPAYEIGYKGAELLIARLEGRIGRGKPVSIKLETKLKIRSSAYEGGQVGASGIHSNLSGWMSASDQLLTTTK